MADKHNAYDSTHEVSSDTTARTRDPIRDTNKSFWDRLWPVIACGAGLFSDGYLNGVIGPVGSILSRAYGKKVYKAGAAMQNVGSITFAGLVVGMLLFGYTSDKYSRKWSLFVSTILVIVFAALATGSYGTDVQGMFTALVVFRFFLGIGIGGEYPAGSVACAESTGELDEGTRNRWFIMFTNVQIDFGFLVAAIVPMVVVLITGEDHLKTAWRVCLGLGVIPPLSLLYLRGKLEDPEAFKQNNVVKSKTPYWLAIKFYWFRLLIVSIIWFLYNFSAYSFYIYMTTILNNLLGSDTALWKEFGWSTLITFFYMPGCIAGSFISDWIGPRKGLAYGVWAQGIVGFLMTGCYKYLYKPQNVGGFVVVYGLFLALGELGPGDNIGLLASKTSATAIRGQYYGFAAAMGKVGAFVGTWTFPLLIDAQKNDLLKGQIPFVLGASLAMLSGCLAFFCLPEVSQDTIQLEDVRFRAYLQQHGWDTSNMGDAGRREHQVESANVPYKA